MVKRCCLLIIFLWLGGCTANQKDATISADLPQPTITTAILSTAASTPISPNPVSPAIINNAPPTVPMPIQNSGNAPQIIHFTASKTAVNRGETITLNWEVRGTASIGITAVGAEPRAMRILAENLPLTGSFDYTIPTEDDYLTRSITVTLQVDSGASAPLQLTVNCPFTVLAVEQACPLTERTAAITFQTFEKGYIIQTDEFTYVLTTDPANYTIYTLPGSASSETPPPGFYAPVALFAPYWNGTDEGGTPAPKLLGWATAPAQTYTATIQDSPTIREMHAVYFRFPDGRVIEVSYYFGRATIWRFMP